MNETQVLALINRETAGYRAKINELEHEVEKLRFQLAEAYIMAESAHRLPENIGLSFDKSLVAQKAAHFIQQSYPPKGVCLPHKHGCVRRIRAAQAGGGSVAAMTADIKTCSICGYSEAK